MIPAAHFVNTLVTGLFDALSWPFLALDPIWALAAISLSSGVLLVWVFGKVSNQDAILAIRNRIRGNLLAVRLFQSEAGVVFRLLGRVVGDTVSYMAHAIVPMAILVVPVVLIMVQLNLRFAVRPLHVGEPLLISVSVRDATSLNARVSLDVPDGVTVETPPVRILSAREVVWRLRVDRAGRHDVVVHVGDATVTTTVVAGPRWSAVPQRRTGRGAWDTLLNPGQPVIAAGHPVAAVDLRYPGLDMRAFTWHVDWLTGFLILSLASGFLFKGALGVEV